MPDPADASTSAAQAAIAEAGRTVGSTRPVASSRSAGTVIRTEPAAGESVPRGTSIRLVVARAKQWRTVGMYSFSSEGQTPRFKIRGERWRITYTMDVSCSYESISECIGTNLTLMPKYDRLDLSKGTHITELAAGPGRYYFEFSSQNPSTLELKVEEFS